MPAKQSIIESDALDFKLFFLVFTDDGLIQQSDLREVMKACMEENGMNFDEKVGCSVVTATSF